MWRIDSGGDKDQVIREVSVTNFVDNVAERFDHNYKYIVMRVTNMEATLFRCKGTNDAIDQVYNRLHNRVERRRREDEEECCEELLGECDDDDIDDLLESNELSWAVDRDDGMSERARNPFLHYEADIVDQEGRIALGLWRMPGSSERVGLGTMYVKSVGGLIPSCGPCRLYSPGLIGLCIISCVFSVRCVCGRGCTTRRTSLNV